MNGLIKIYNNMETKKLQITPPEGYEIDKVNSTFEEIVFKKIENRLPMSWEALKEVKGYYIDGCSAISYVCNAQTYSHTNMNVFPSKKEAVAMLAMAQLCQLRDVWNEGWEPDWKNDKEIKYCIIPYGDAINKTTEIYTGSPIAFKISELRDEFFRTFRDLLEIAKPFL